MEGKRSTPAVGRNSVSNQAPASATGLYRVEIPLVRIKGDSITISVNHIGYKSAVLTIPVLAGPNMMDFYLTQDAIIMKEVVKRADAWVEPTRAEKARGYHSEIINLDEIRLSGARNPIDILRGKIAGIVIDNAGGGMLGSVPLIQMRGQQYLNPNSNTQPLLVVDGMPFSHDYGRTEDNRKFIMDTILDIGIDNIASIEVVKGQGMYWRYGREAANGCIITTTRK